MTISLTSAMRSNLFALQQTADQMDTTQQRLASGKKVNSALDNPSSYFAALGHNQRADALFARKEAIGEAIQTTKKADEGITAISKILEAARGVLTSARAAVGDATKMAELQAQYGSLMTQLDNIVTDSAYKGVNLLNGGALTVVLNENNTTDVTLDGFDATNGGTVVTATDVTWDGTTTSANLDTVEDTINASLSNLNTESSKLAANMSVLQIRSDFITSSVNTLREGADKLTLADLNEEGANMLMLQTRQQMSMAALSISSQAASSILRLF